MTQGWTTATDGDSGRADRMAWVACLIGVVLSLLTGGLAPVWAGTFGASYRLDFLVSGGCRTDSGTLDTGLVLGERELSRAFMAGFISCPNASSEVFSKAIVRPGELRGFTSATFGGSNVGNPLGLFGNITQTLTFGDELQVVSDVLPVGTEVSIEMRQVVGGRFTIEPLDAGCTGGDPSTARVFGTVQATLTAFTGSGFEIAFPTRYTADSCLGVTEDRSSIDFVSRVGDFLFVREGLMTGAFSPGGSVIVDFFDTANSYLDVLTPGASLESASGHDYATPTTACGVLGSPPCSSVPVPPSLLLVAAGIGGLTLFRHGAGLRGK